MFGEAPHHFGYSRPARSSWRPDSLTREPIPVRTAHRIINRGSWLKAAFWETIVMDAVQKSDLSRRSARKRRRLPRARDPAFLVRRDGEPNCLDSFVGLCRSR